MSFGSSLLGTKTVNQSKTYRIIRSENVVTLLNSCSSYYFGTTAGVRGSEGEVRDRILQLRTACKNYEGATKIKLADCNIYYFINLLASVPLLSF